MSGPTGDDPARIGPYRIERRLGQGGMGRVYLGRSASGRAVAVKVVRPDLAEHADFRRRFAREVAAARAVSGAFTAAVVDAAPDAPSPWLATVYVDGMALSDAVARYGPWPVGPLRALGAGLAEALAAIHAVGVIHRDLKPSNVMLAADGPKVIDFGISRAVEASVLTRTGSTVGSPGFMSPEQCADREVGEPSDVFSLGAVLAFAGRGSGPFGHGSVPALLYRVVHDAPDLDGVPAPLVPLVSACLDKSPTARPTAAEVLAELAIDASVAGAGAGWWLPAAVAGAIPGGGRDGAPVGAAPVDGGAPAGTVPMDEGVPQASAVTVPVPADVVEEGAVPPVPPPPRTDPVPPVPPMPGGPPRPDGFPGFLPPPPPKPPRAWPRYRAFLAAGSVVVVSAITVAVVLATRDDDAGNRSAGTPKPTASATRSATTGPPTRPAASVPSGGQPSSASSPAASAPPRTQPDIRALDVTKGAGGLVTRVLEPGSGPEIRAGQQITVDYVGVYQSDRAVFDSSWSRGEPAVFGIGTGEVIPGWDEGLVGQRVGSRVQLVIPPDKAYGATPPGEMRPNATLVFVIDLIAAR
ncbi:protein kinase domain-containing protein [Embleya scabrispora]|uniref:protein kinase domain-containing protein n=1 Tax=Embleya scabrispora TaxID=159449 RepID=UPI00117C5A5D|nr:FKBP-type peptidyl-prolyl cis-trans isomerase [Embleya scabrispora]